MYICSILIECFTSGFEHDIETYQGPCQTQMMELFKKITTGF